jgi:Raf kinase inhibitor-like YbhB/YbcL family protein
MKISSPVFEENGSIPEKYGADFENVNPPLLIQEVPDGTVSLALIMDDPDIPEKFGIPVFDHWIVFNIPPTTEIIGENWGVEGVQGAGTRGESKYMGPRPPDREHRYFFRVYALDTMLDLPEGTNREGLTRAMAGHIVGEAELMGRYAPKV